MDKVILFAWCSVLHISLVVMVNGTSEQPDQGFFLAVTSPVVGRKSTHIYVYAIQTDVQFNDGKVEISKDTAISSTAIRVNAIEGDGIQWGCYLDVGQSYRLLGTRFGRYTGKFTPDNPTRAVETGYAFVKPMSKFLDTRGVVTVTAYPSEEGSETLSPIDPIGVAFSSCRKFLWRKGKKRLQNTRPRLDIKSINDGGLYTISRGSRSKQGWHAQILVIIATCPRGMYGTTSCRSGPDCKNGGVIRDKTSDCICPPFFGYFDCRCVVPSREDDLFTLGDTRNGEELYCKDLPGGDKNCQGLMVCYGDTYGCKCSPGWHGNGCDQPCRKGTWGANCELRCPLSEPDCNRFFGPKENLPSEGCF